MEAAEAIWIAMAFVNGVLLAYGVTRRADDARVRFTGWFIAAVAITTMLTAVSLFPWGYAENMPLVGEPTYPR